MVMTLSVSPVDQANKAAEEGSNQGEDDEVSEEYEHPPWLLGGSSEAPWRILPWPSLAADWPKVLREPEGRGAEGREREMQSANKEGNNVKLRHKLYEIRSCQNQNQFCLTFWKYILLKVNNPPQDL